MCCNTSGYSCYSCDGIAKANDLAHIDRMAADDDIPKCSLPPKKRGTKPKPRKRAAAKKPAARKGKPIMPAEVTVEKWDAAAVAAEAKAVVSKRGRKATKPLTPEIEKSGAPDPRYDPKPDKAMRKKMAAEAREEAAKEKEDRMVAILEELRAGEKRMVTDEIFSAICILVASGIPLRQVCRREGMPSRTALVKFMQDDTDPLLQRDRLARYARARTIGFDDLAEEALEIADDGSNDYMERERDGSTEVVLDREHIQRSKLRFDARMKLLSVWDPQRYGDRLALADPNGEALGTGAARERSVSDMAIGISKILEARKRTAGLLEDGQTIEGEVDE